MNRGNVRRKRSIGKSSPLSKRPKLEFSLKPTDCLLAEKNINFNGSYEKTIKDTSTAVNCLENKLSGNCTAEPDWDDDFSGDMLEKVCLIADLSQAMVNNQTVTEKLEKIESKVEIFEANNKFSSVVESGNSISNEDYEKLKSEFIQLQEKLKTKEGEVHILRSQLKQNEDTKQAAALQNIKVMEEMEKKYNEKINLTENELETFKSKLQFKDMEYKTLSERCRQLEYCISKNKLEDLHCTQADGTKSFGGFSQAIQQKFQNIERENEHDVNTAVKQSNKEALEIDFCNLTLHEGKHLEKCLCPEVFEFIEEPSVIHFHTFRSGPNYRKSKLGYNKREKYKWSDLPQQTIFLKDLYDSVSSLFVHETFNHKETKRKVEKILEHCEKILLHNKEVLLFLEKLHLHNCDYDDSDQYLLENEDEIHSLTIKSLLRGEKLSAEECGIEGRRTLALICALMTASQVASEFLKSKPNFVMNLKCIASSIGNLRRPLRYTGILVGISFILKRLLEERNLEKEIVALINEAVEEIIFARPKLDVLMEVVNVLAAGKNHFTFLSSLCRKASLDSCSLYMDSKLKQAMFFTKNACPLKLLCMQIMGLACLPSSRNIKWDLTDSIIKWLNNSINTPMNKKIKWLPINSFLNEKDRCFDPTECLLYLLTLCLKDYQVRFSSEESSEVEANIGQIQSKTDPDGRRNLISIIGHGAVLLKRILKTDQRQLQDNSYSVRFAVLLKCLTMEKAQFSTNHLSSVQLEAMRWLTDSLEGDLRNQDCYPKQTTLKIPQADILSALKIDDESKMY